MDDTIKEKSESADPPAITESLNSCGRCHQRKGRLFRIEPNRSFQPDGSFPEQSLDVVSCKECLTDDEIARLLSPVALFVIDTLFAHRAADAAHVRAVLLYRCGGLSDPREKALAAL